jgi:hypothetical protein
MPSSPEAELASHSGHSASRAEPPPDARFRRVLGGLVVLVLVLGFLYKMLNGRPSSVPMGIAGFGLGMSVERAREVLPGLTEIAPDPAGLDPGAQLPRLRGRVQVFEEPATCTLWFAIEHTLSKIECALDPEANADERQKTAERVLVTLQKLHGSEQPGSLATPTRVWQNQRATLQLHVPEGDGSVVLVNAASGHDGAVTELLAARKSAHEREVVTRERDRLKRQLEELKELERERREAGSAVADAGL